MKKAKREKELTEIHGLSECPTGAHLVWWPVTETAECPWCVIFDLQDAFRRIHEICDHNE